MGKIKNTKLFIKLGLIIVLFIGEIVGFYFFFNNYLAGLRLPSADVTSLIIISLSGLAIVGLTIFIAMLIVISNITRPMNRLADISKYLAEGDLQFKIDEKLVKGNDHIGNLGKAFNYMIQNLKPLIENIKTTSISTSSAAAQLSASSEQVNSSMEHVNLAIKKIATGTQIVSKNSTDVKMAAEKAEISVKEGYNSTKIVTEKMKSISQAAKTSAEKMDNLGTKSSEIGKIVGTINNMAEQTNLLALNAAIEAARAGEAGRGFAVVADEVRRLAEESGKASSQITELISNIQMEIHEAVVSMEENTQQVEEGDSSIQNALKSFDIIPVLLENINRILGDMSTVAHENAMASDEVSSSVGETTAIMQQVASSAQQLNANAETLRHFVNKFKLN